MKKTLLIIMLISCITANYAENELARMQQANKEYQSENYSGAVDLYKQLVNDGNESSALYYNLGNAYYKSGSNAQALLWYERALRLDPTNEDIKHNIAFVNQKITDKIEPVPESAIEMMWNRSSHKLTENQWAILSIVFSCLLILALAGFIFGRSGGLRIGGGIVFCLSIFMLVFTIIFAAKEHNRFARHDEAIVMNMVTEAKSSPTEKGNTIFVIHEGLKVQITKEVENYVEIRIPSGEKGWISKMSIEKI